MRSVVNLHPRVFSLEFPPLNRRFAVDYITMLAIHPLLRSRRRGIAGRVHLFILEHEEDVTYPDPDFLGFS
jgi:hypothetical protein